MEWEKIFVNYISDKGLIAKNTKNSYTQHKKKLYLKINIFFQRKHANSQWAHEKMLKITNHQGKANQNHNKLSPQNGYYQKDNN